MRRDRTSIAIVGMLLFLAALAAGCGSSGKREGQIGTSETASVTVQKGDPELAAASGYAGSKACSACHPKQFAGWGNSLHNAPLKTVAELGDGIFVNDADGNGTNDFRDGLDLSANPNFSAFGANAPILSVAGGKYLITIGTVSYEVQRTQGGNGFWKQRYHTKIGRSYYILPVQYNEKTKEYVRYNTDHWYDGSNLPRFTGTYTDNNLVPQFAALNVSPGKLGTARSWENRCAGCHQTGLTAKAETTSYGGTNVEEVVTGYSELNIGCEQCHGPGAQHAATANPAFIINPQSLVTIFGVREGGRLANQVCGSCHHRGEGNATLGSMSLALEYPARKVSGVLGFPTPGVSVIDNSAGNPFVLLNTGTAYYGTAPNVYVDESREIYSAYRNWYSNYPEFRIYVASRQHHQQWTDVEQGPHSADTGGLTCWDCHDPHKAKGDHQVRSQVTVAGTTLSTSNDDNSLCLACHSADFGLSPNDVRIGGAKVAGAVLGHMGTEAVMGTVTYDPKGTGVGRCSKCHMPKTSSSAITTAFGTGLKEGDIHNHTFNTIWPSANIRLPFVSGANPAEMVNSCYSVGCHNNDSASALYVPEVDSWSKSGHADFTSEPFRHWDEDGEVSTSCARCHSKFGYRDFARDGVVNAAAKLGSKISCGACHTEEGDGTTLFDKPSVYPAIASVPFPSGIAQTMGDASNICMACHQGRAWKGTVDTATPSGGKFRFVNIHYFAASASFFGADVKGGYEYDNTSFIGAQTYTGRADQNIYAGTDMEGVRDTCVRCHMVDDGTGRNHNGKPRLSDCTTSGCHTGGSFQTLDLGASDNYDDIQALKSQLATVLTNSGVVFLADYPYFDNLVTKAQLKAAYNWQVADKEPCGYIHNPDYIRQLLYDSIRDLSLGTVTPVVARP